MAKRWNGFGIAASTGVTSGNVNNAGNGDTVTLSTSGTFTIATTSGADGVDVTTAASGICRYDCTLPTAGLYAVHQVLFTPKETPSANTSVGVFRSTSAFVAQATHKSNGKFSVLDSASAEALASVSTVALTLNHEYLLDAIAVIGGSSTTGRYVYRIKDLTDNTWNTTGEFYYDSGYTLTLGVANITLIRALKSSSNVWSTGGKFRRIGWDSPASIDTSLDPTITKAQFLPYPILSADENVTVETATISTAGSVGKAGDATSTALTATISVTGNVDHPASNSTTVTNTITATGLAQYNATDTTTTTVGITADGRVDKSDSPSVFATTATISSSGLVSHSSDNATTVTVGITSSGLVAHSTSTPDTTISVGISSTGQTTLVATNATAITAGITASGQVNKSVDSNSIDETVSISVSGISNKFVNLPVMTTTVATSATGITGFLVDSSIPLTVGISSNGIVGNVGDTTVSESISIVVSGTKGLNASATALAVSVGVVASGSVTSGGTGIASTSTTTTISSSGRLDAFSDETTILTLGINSTGSVGGTRDTTVGVGVGITASGVVGKRASVALALTSTVFTAGTKPNTGVIVKVRHTSGSSWLVADPKVKIGGVWVSINVRVHTDTGWH